jgi:enoyl-CoA hydratase/3-hydroxyacyl-CoA dehydrogenase
VNPAKPLPAGDTVASSASDSRLYKPNQLPLRVKKATSDVDLVSESVFERADVKRQIHQKLDELCPSKTILTTNTSSYLVSEIEDVVERGDRFAAMHAYLGSMLIDIVGGPRTNPETIDILRRYVLSLGGNPMVLKKEYPGYVVNAILGPLLMTACLLVSEGQATVEEVDKAWMSKSKTSVGPFGMLDFFGLDLSLDNTLKEHPDPYITNQRQKVGPVMASYVERGELGLKTGKGFYSYPNPLYEQDDFLAEQVDRSAIYYELAAGIIQAGTQVVLDDVVGFEDADRGWMITHSMDIGPFGLLDQLGIDTFLDIFESQVKTRVNSPENTELIKSYLQQFVSRNEVGEKTGQGFYSHPDPVYRKPEFIKVQN